MMIMDRELTDREKIDILNRIAVAGDEYIDLIDDVNQRIISGDISHYEGAILINKILDADTGV
jgi:hypothetical protein